MTGSRYGRGCVRSLAVALGLLLVASVAATSPAFAADHDEAYYKRTATKPPKPLELSSEAGAFWYNGLGLSWGLGYQVPKGPKIIGSLMYGHLNGIDQTINYKIGCRNYQIPVDGESKRQWGLMFSISTPIKAKK